MKKGNAVIEKELPDPADFQSAQGLLVDIENRSPALVRVALGLSTLPDWNYFESPPVYIRPGPNPNIVFRLKGRDFKAASTNWEYRAALQNAGEVKKDFFLIYAVRPGTLRFDNIRLSLISSQN